MMKVALTIQSPLLIIVQFKNDYEIILYFYHLKKRDFYNFVSKFMPDYKERERLLKID